MIIIGDVHGHITDENALGRSYKNIVENCDNSVQIGDLGHNFFSEFDSATEYSYLIDEVNSDHHKFIPGNHDNYDDLPIHSLGDFGIYTMEGIEFFFVRGAWSPDFQIRLVYEQEYGVKTWWPQEELTQMQGEEAIAIYEAEKPRIVLSHECPTKVKNLINERFSTSITNQILNTMLKIHKPELWIFGHYHKDMEFKVDGTRFICLDELSTFDLR